MVQFSHRAVLALLPSLLISAAGVARAAELPTEPGYHRGQELPGKPEWTYDLYLPRAYAERQKAPGLRFPVVFLLAVGRAPLVDWADQHKVLEWEESRRVIVIGVNERFDCDRTHAAIQVRDPNRPASEAMESYMALADALPGAHPALRLVMNTDSFLSPRDWFVALRFPGKVAGITLGPHNVYTITEREPLLPASCAVATFIVTREAYFNGRPHEGMPSSTEEQMAYPRWFSGVGAKLRENGNAMRSFVNIDWNIAVEPTLQALTWMLDVAWLTNAGVNDDERRAAWVSIRARVQSTQRVKDPAVRRARLANLLSIPAVAEHEVGAGLLGAWRDAALEDARSQKERFFRHAALTELCDDPRMKDGGRESPQLVAAREALAPLRDDPVIADEAIALLELSALQPRLMRVHGGSIEELKEVRAAVARLAESHPKTLSGAKARADLVWMDRLIPEREEAERKRVAEQEEAERMKLKPRRPLED